MQCSEKLIYVPRSSCAQNRQKRYCCSAFPPLTTFLYMWLLLSPVKVMFQLMSQMNLQLRGSVILLDEAHNIEDCCREAGSCSVLYDDIFQSVKDCKRVASMELLPEVHNSLVQNHVLKLCMFVRACACTCTFCFCCKSKIMFKL